MSSVVLVLALVLAEEVEARGQRLHAVLAGLLAQALYELVRGGKDVIPAKNSPITNTSTFFSNPKNIPLTTRIIPSARPTLPPDHNPKNKIIIPIPIPSKISMILNSIL